MYYYKNAGRGRVLVGLLIICFLTGSLSLRSPRRLAFKKVPNSHRYQTDVLRMGLTNGNIFMNKCRCFVKTFQGALTMTN